MYICVLVAFVLIFNKVFTVSGFFPHLPNGGYEAYSLDASSIKSTNIGEQIMCQSLYVLESTSAEWNKVSVLLVIVTPK